MNALRFVLKGAVLLMAVGLIVGATVLGVAYRALQPTPDEWAMSLRTGPWTHRLSVPVLLRWATHPLVLPLFDNRTLRTPAGRWYLRTARDGGVHAVCAPCQMHLSALGPGALRLNAVEVDVERDGPNGWRGTMTLGETSDAVRWTWRAQLVREGLRFQADLPSTPIAAMLAVFGDAIPELQHARIQGEAAFRVRGTVDAHGLRDWRITPSLSHVDVDGLGTEALRSAQPSHGPGCTLTDGSMQPLRGWLPRAVIAAEDQRFYEHAGYDLQEWLASWTRHTRGESKPRGASTITQQLAKLVYVGDERSPARKLREWLYAVEMERTLGKARILQLYLALAPWGAGTCGAPSAALQHLRKPASQLKLHEAAWLASLLTRPDPWLRNARTHVDDHRARASRVVDAMRPLALERRQAAMEVLQRWEPPHRALSQGVAGAKTHQRDVVNTPSL